MAETPDRITRDQSLSPVLRLSEGYGLDPDSDVYINRQILNSIYSNHCIGIYALEHRVDKPAASKIIGGGLRGKYDKLIP